MGITFGDEADVEVHGDMVGGDKVTASHQGADWNSVVALIVAQDIGTEAATEAVQAVSTIKQQLDGGSVQPTVLQMAASAVKRIAPAAFELLLKVAPQLVAMLPDLVAR